MPRIARTLASSIHAAPAPIARERGSKKLRGPAASGVDESSARPVILAPLGDDGLGSAPFEAFWAEPSPRACTESEKSTASPSAVSVAFTRPAVAFRESAAAEARVGGA